MNESGAASRPPVSVIVPFAGDEAAAGRTVAALARLRLTSDDELILADNSATLVGAPHPPRVSVVPTGPERSSYHARNAGAARARNDWLLFIDADCAPEPDLLDAYFAQPPGDEEGALAGQVIPDPDQDVLTARYTRARGYLEQAQTLADDFRPHAVTANLLVRRRAYESIGGFAEGVRSGADTEFSWRLQEAGWRIGHRPAARVTHRNRESLRAFARVTARYAAGRAWLRRRYPESFTDRRPLRQLARATVAAARWTLTGRPERARMRAMDALVSAVDLTAARLPNRADNRPRPVGPADLVVLTDSFPELSETFIVSELDALTRAGLTVRVEAGRRASRQNLAAVHATATDYAEDDSALDKLIATAWLIARHPLRAAADLLPRRRWRREEPVPPLRAIAPAARRLARDPRARLHCHFAAGAALTTLRLSRLTRRPYSLTAHAYDIFREPRNLREKLQAADIVTTGCEYNLRHLRSLVDPPHRFRVHEVVMGVDAQRFTRTRPLPDGRTVIAIGRLVEKKGFTDLVTAISLLSPQTAQRLVLIGDGPLGQQLRELARRLDVADRVEFRGALDHETVREELERADVLAMPCVVAADGDRDSMPVVVKEALALEVPVVATDEVGLPELVHDGWGRLVAPHDPQALAEALQAVLLLPPSERAELGRAGRSFVAEHCDVRRETAKLIALLGLTAQRA